MISIDVRSCACVCAVIAALVVTQSACGSTDAPSAPSVSTESSAGEPAPSPSPAPSPAPTPAPSPTPAPAPAQVSVAGSVRDALNGGKVGWGMIERFQEGNPSGEKLYQSPGGNCYKCSWSNDPAQNGNFTFPVTAGKPFRLTVTVAGFESQTRELTIVEATTIDFALVPLPVKIGYSVTDSFTEERPVRCMPVLIEFLDGPNAGRVVSLTSGTSLDIENLVPTDSTVRVSAPAYQTKEATLRIRPDNDYPSRAGSYGARLTCKTCTSYYEPISCNQ